MSTSEKEEAIVKSTAPPFGQTERKAASHDNSSTFGDNETAIGITGYSHCNGRAMAIAAASSATAMAMTKAAEGPPPTQPQNTSPTSKRPSVRLLSPVEPFPSPTRPDSPTAGNEAGVAKRRKGGVLLFGDERGGGGGAMRRRVRR